MMRAALACAMAISVGWAVVGCDRLTGDRPPAPLEAASEPEVAVVDWLGRGRLYAAKITARRDGLTRVEYADGDREWVEAERLRPWPELTGRRVQVWTRHTAQSVTVIETRGGLLHVRFDDGSHTWFGLDMLYALDAGEAVEGPGGDGDRPPPPPPPAFPIRAAVDPARIRPGLHALTYWVNDSGVQRAQPWLTEILTVEGERVHVRFLSDGSEGDVQREHVLRLFEPPARPAVGQRAWVAASPPTGIVREERAGLVKIVTGEDERWVEAEHVLAAAPPIGRVEPGMLVTALWNGTTLYHATVQGTAGDQVLLAWHDGSTPSGVPSTDVVEVWQAAPP